MQVLTERLTRGQMAMRTIADDGNAWVFFGQDTRLALRAATGARSVWIPLRGSLSVSGAAFSESVQRKTLLVTVREQHIEVVTPNHGAWIGIAAGKLAWRHLLGEMQPGDLQPIPGRFAADRNLRRRAIATVRAANSLHRTNALRATLVALDSEQQRARDRLARCPGRTYAQKQRVFLRLQRVREVMRTQCGAELTNAALARLANYSPQHFLRIFELVYRETPHHYLIRKRLDRAAHLLSSGDLAVTEVALASGFENASTFSRSFHHHFGVTAKETRYRAVHAVSA